MDTKILIVDDHPIFREGLNAILSEVPGVEVIGDADNGLTAIEKARLLKPDIILMDISMPVMNGTEATHMIKRRQPDIKVIILTANRSSEHVHAALEAGANGYLLKNDTSINLLNAIESISNGNAYLSPGIVDTVLVGFLGETNEEKSMNSWHRLTLREREVMKLVAEGCKNREIALKLSLSIKTVEKHRSNMMNKLNIHCVPALTVYALEHQLINI